MFATLPAAQSLLDLLDEAAAMLSAHRFTRWAKGLAADRGVIVQRDARSAAEFVLSGDSALGRIDDHLLPGAIRGVLRQLHRTAHDLAGEPMATCCARPGCSRRSRPWVVPSDG
jgi:hypothetical protein